MAPTTRDTHVAREVGTPKLETQTGQFSFGGPLINRSLTILSTDFW